MGLHADLVFRTGARTIRALTEGLLLIGSDAFQPTTRSNEFAKVSFTCSFKVVRERFKSPSQPGINSCAPPPLVLCTTLLRCQTLPAAHMPMFVATLVTLALRTCSQRRRQAKLIAMFTQAKELSLRKLILPTKPLVSKASMLSFKFTRCGDAAYLRYVLVATGSLHIDCRAARARRQSISVLWFVVLSCQCSSISIRRLEQRHCSADNTGRPLDHRGWVALASLASASCMKYLSSFV